MFDVFISDRPAGGEGPYLSVWYGRPGRLPRDPTDGTWRYLATVRSELDTRLRLGEEGLSRIAQNGFHITWQPPI